MSMIKFRVLLFAVLLPFLISCETNPPNSMIIEPVYGFAIVTSDIPGSQIFIDNVFSGKVTPDTIKAEIGEHEIHLVNGSSITAPVKVLFEESQFKNINIKFESAAVKKIVLIEDFANVSCAPCVVSNHAIEQLTKQTFGSSKVIAIKFATNFPSPNDPFYLSNTSMSDNRNSYYNILFAPTVIVDGILRPISTDSNSIRSKIETRLLIEPKFNLSVVAQLNGSKYDATISLEILSTDQIDFNELHLFSYLIEKEIQFSTPPGNNGETIFYNVCRETLPTNEGESLSFIGSTGTYNFQRSFSTSSLSNVNQAAVVVFIQNKATKEVFQTAATF